MSSLMLQDFMFSSFLCLHHISDIILYINVRTSLFPEAIREGVSGGRFARGPHYALAWKVSCSLLLFSCTFLSLYLTFLFFPLPFLSPSLPFPSSLCFLYRFVSARSVCSPLYFHISPSLIDVSECHRLFTSVTSITS